jgi:hypothetical protein
VVVEEVEEVDPSGGSDVVDAGEDGEVLVDPPVEPPSDPPGRTEVVVDPPDPPGTVVDGVEPVGTPVVVVDLALPGSPGPLFG